MRLLVSGTDLCCDSGGNGKRDDFRGDEGCDRLKNRSKMGAYLTLLPGTAMASPSWLRYVLARLSFFTRPVPLVSSLAVVILGIFIWENINHPEWFGTYSQEDAGPNENLDLSGLTPEEQAAVADIDNLTVLLNDLGLGMEGQPTIQAVPDIADDSNLLEQDLLAIATPTPEADSQVRQNPFQQYLEQYQFGGSSSQPVLESSAIIRNGESLNGPTAEALLTDSPSSQSTALSPLQQALQNSQVSVDESDRPLEAPTSGLEPTDSGQASNSSASALPVENDSLGLPTEQQNTQGLTIPGVPFPVLSPTVQTSPPPGTTGYTPPASLGPSPPAGSRPSGLPTTGTVPPTGVTDALTRPSTTPNLDLGAPVVTSSPAAPVVPPPTAAPASPSIEPSPFSVPRPPGSVTGGGYINTFSNPSAPPDGN